MERMKKRDHKGEGGKATPSVLRVERRKQAFSVFGGAVEQAGDHESALALAQLLTPDPGLARALTHGFHSYAGRMHPFTARTAIARFSQPGQDVLDPFCGSGNGPGRGHGRGSQGRGQ